MIKCSAADGRAQCVMFVDEVIRMNIDSVSWIRKLKAFVLEAQAVVGELSFRAAARVLRDGAAARVRRGWNSHYL